MTKQEQIEEMRREIRNGFRKADCRKPYTNEPYPYFETQITTIAEALYNAGYRKIDDFEAENERLREVIRQLNTEYNRAWERLKSDCREIGELKAENRQLKTECALLDDELRIARQDTIDVLNKLKDYVDQLACDEYGDSACDTNYVTIDIDKYEQDIDEMIEEQLKK